MGWDKYKVYPQKSHLTGRCDYIWHVPDWAMCQVESTNPNNAVVEAMTQKIVDVLNFPLPLSEGRYYVTGKRSFRDRRQQIAGNKWEQGVGLDVEYSLLPDDEHAPYEDIATIVGMLNTYDVSNQGGS